MPDAAFSFAFCSWLVYSRLKFYWSCWRSWLVTLCLFHPLASFSLAQVSRGSRGRPRECFLPRSFGAFLSESSAGAPLPVRAPRASRHERRTWADRPHNQDRKLPLLLILAGHEAHGGATASGGEDRAKPHRAKIVPAHGCAARKHSAELAETSRWLNNRSSNTPPRGPTLLSISAQDKEENRTGAIRPAPTHSEGSSCSWGSGGSLLSLHRGARAG